MTPKVAVVVFPGSNCEQDVAYALELAGADPVYVWHGDSELGDVQAAILPGGFAHGDYLRPGAIARFSAVMRPVEELAERGGPVLGICNGFQVLCEAGLVPGALMQNAGLRFLCTWTELVVDDVDTPFTCAAERGATLRIPINHYEGNYVPASAEEPRIIVAYTDNPNGSWHAVAGVANARGNVAGMMPHPERACERWMGSTDGSRVFSSLVTWCREGAGVSL